MTLGYERILEYDHLNLREKNTELITCCAGEFTLRRMREKGEGEELDCSTFCSFSFVYSGWLSVRSQLVKCMSANLGFIMNKDMGCITSTLNPQQNLIQLQLRCLFSAQSPWALYLLIGWRLYTTLQWMAIWLNVDQARQRAKAFLWQNADWSLWATEKSQGCQVSVVHKSILPTSPWLIYPSLE